VRGPSYLASYRGRITKQVMVLLCKRVSRRIGRRLHPHLFRHTFATELLNRRAVANLLSLEGRRRVPCGDGRLSLGAFDAQKEAAAYYAG